MRTIRVEVRSQIDRDNSVVLSTEAIVADDADAEQAGRDAATAITNFSTGWGEVQGSEP